EFRRVLFRSTVGRFAYLEVYTMSHPVIQFSRLEEFVAEPPGRDSVVRVVTLETVESVASQLPGLRRVGIGVHVRTINPEGHILACYLPVARIELYNGRREGDPTWQAYDEAWSQAQALQQRVLIYLREVAARQGFTVRAAGVVDLGETVLLRARWPSDPAGAARGPVHEMDT